jgi:GNAT superfamily N-acetyltransferase
VDEKALTARRVTGISEMRVTCTKMTMQRQGDASRLLNDFLRKDDYYLASSSAYGDEGLPALKRALRKFLRHPELGFVWLAYIGSEAVGVCVVSFAISTSIGGLVAKLDDVFVVEERRRQGVATQMLLALKTKLKRMGILRIDSSIYKKNRSAKKYYEALGFKPLGEERIALLL